MPSTSIALEVFHHTPKWVWAVLLALVVFGGRQLQDQAVSRVRLVALPLLMMGWSLASAASAFGAQAAVAVAWGAGLGLAFLVGQRLPASTRGGLLADGRVVLPGSPWPLVGMLSIFVLRYAVNVGLVLAPQAASGPVGPVLAMLYGALSGAFAVRALRSLRPAGGLAAAA